MTAPRPPLHQIDAHHALTCEAITQWIAAVYPGELALNTDRTQRWFNIASNLASLLADDPNPADAHARLVQMTAELLLRTAEHERTRTS